MFHRIALARSQKVADLSSHNEPRCIQATAGLCFGFAKRSVIYPDSSANQHPLGPHGRYRTKISNCRRWTFRPDRYCRLSRHRDPEPVGVNCTVPVESSLLHCFAIDELSNEGTFCFRPALMNNVGNILMFPFFARLSIFFERLPRKPNRVGGSCDADPAAYFEARSPQARSGSPSAKLP
jgi:hypothetical protein